MREKKQPARPLPEKVGSNNQTVPKKRQSEGQEKQTAEGGKEEAEKLCSWWKWELHQALSGAQGLGYQTAHSYRWISNAAVETGRQEGEPHRHSRLRSQSEWMSSHQGKRTKGKQASLEQKWPERKSCCRQCQGSWLIGEQEAFTWNVWQQLSRTSLTFCCLSPRQRGESHMKHTALSAERSVKAYSSLGNAVYLLCRLRLWFFFDPKT